jgi:hypothetical protein
MLATTEVAGVAHTANNTWEQVASMSFYARKGEVYLVRVAATGISASNNFDDEYFSLAIQTIADAAVVLENTSNRYSRPARTHVANRASSVNRSGDLMNRSSLFLIAGMPEGPVTVSIQHWDGNTSMDRTIHYLYASIRRVGLPQRKWLPGPLGWPLRAPPQRRSRLIGHVVDTSTRTLTGVNTNERITGTEIAFTPKPDHEYEYVAYVLARGTTADFDRQYYVPFIDNGDNIGYRSPSDTSPGYSASPSQHELVNLSAAAQTGNQRGLSLHGSLYDFQALGPKSFAIAMNDNNTGVDREVVYTSVVLLEAVPSSYGVAA